MTLPLLFVSLIIPFLYGLTIVSLAWNGRQNGAFLIKCVTGGIVGLGFSTISMFAWLFVSGGRLNFYLAAEAVFMAATIIAAVGLKRRFFSCKPDQMHEKAVENSVPQLRILSRKIVLSLVFLLLTLQFSAVFLASNNSPRGRWDAWAIWNLRARHIFHGGSNWTNAFSETMTDSHLDYPLFLPLAVVRGWIVAGHDTTAVPMGYGILFSLLTTILLFAGIYAQSNLYNGLAAVAILNSTSFFINLSSWQYADILVGLIFLATSISISIYIRSSQPGLSFLIGLLAGFAAWVKNEGLVFTGLSVTTMLIIAVFQKYNNRKSLRFTTTSFLCGLLPGAAITLFFKLWVPHTNDLVQGIQSAQLATFLQPGRAFEIIQYFAQSVFFPSPHHVFPHYFPVGSMLLVYLMLKGFKPKAKLDYLLLLPILGMGAAYFLAYLTTPRDLTWHLQTSHNRLFMQIWPTIIFVFFLTANFSGAQNQSEHLTKTEVHG